MTNRKAFIIYEDELNGIESQVTSVFTEPIRNRKTINENEAKLAGKLLDLAAESLGGHCCNDLPDEVWAGWTIEERRQFCKDYEEFNSTPEEYNPMNIDLLDWQVMGFLAYKLGYRSPYIPPPKKLLTDDQVRNDSQLIQQHNQSGALKFRGVYDGNNFLLYEHTEQTGKKGWLLTHARLPEKRDGEYPRFVPERPE